MVIEGFAFANHTTCMISRNAAVSEIKLYRSRRFLHGCTLYWLFSIQGFCKKNYLRVGTLLPRFVLHPLSTILSFRNIIPLPYSEIWSFPGRYWEYPPPSNINTVFYIPNMYSVIWLTWKTDVQCYVTGFHIIMRKFLFEMAH